MFAWNVARKCENLCLNSFCDVLSIWCRKQCLSLSNAGTCIIGHLTADHPILFVSRRSFLAIEMFKKDQNNRTLLGEAECKRILL